MAAAVESMAYAGEVPWHGLGVQVDSNLTPKEMLVEVGQSVSVKYLLMTTLTQISQKT